MRRLPILLLFFAACATRVPSVTPEDATRAGVSQAELTRGRSLFLDHCGACHLPPKPTSQAPDVWSQRVGEMKRRAHLDDGQAALVERYLVTMATRQD